MNEAKNKNLFIRVSEKEKNIIVQNAKKCGLSVSEYLRQRALGYMPSDSVTSFTATNRAKYPLLFFHLYSPVKNISFKILHYHIVCTSDNTINKNNSCYDIYSNS